MAADETEHRTPLDLETVKATWLRQCGSCDAGLPMDCTCPDGDYRTVMSELVAEVDQLRRGALHRIVGLIPTGELRNEVARIVSGADEGDKHG